MVENWIIGLAGLIGGVLMAIKNKMTALIVVFSGVAGYFIAVLSVTIVDKFYPMADGDVKYSVGFFFGMASNYIIREYDDLVNFVINKLKFYVNKKVGQDENK